MVRPLASLILAVILFAGLSGMTVEAGGQVARPVPRRLDRKPKFVGDAETIRFINAEIRDGWRQGNLEPSPKAPDGEWCRRVYLDVIGRIPMLDELQRFEREPPASRRSLLVHRLLDSDEYAEEYAHYWATVWSHVLVGRPSPSEAGTMRSMTNYEGLRQYLRTSLFDNKPYDVMVYELLTATGDTTPGEPGFNGATNFLVDGLQDEAVEATKRAATSFIGFRAQCAQCHCEPCTGWSQSQYWSLNAFFRQARVQRISSPDGREHAILDDVDFVGESNHRQQAEVYFQSIQGKMEVAYPAYIDGTKINASGELQSVHRRAELGHLVIHSDQLGTAIANRLWTQLFGFGFSAYGVEHLGLRGEFVRSSIPATLGHEFAARGFDLKQLIRWLVLCEPYSLSSRITDKNRTDQHGRDMSPSFSHFYLRHMQPEQIYASVLVASGGYLAGSDRAHWAERDKVVGELAVAAGQTSENHAAPPSGTVPLALTMMNGPLTSQATGLASSLLSLRPGTPKLDPIDSIFLAALARKPTRSQRSFAVQMLAEHSVEPAAAYQDILWAVINSNEFIFNH